MKFSDCWVDACLRRAVDKRTACNDLDKFAVFLSGGLDSSITDWRASRNRLLADLHRTELRRIDGAAMAHAVEIRCPFLDQDLRDLAEGLNFEDFYGDVDSPTPKTVLRRAFSSMLPELIVQRRKKPLDRGTGLQKLVVNHCTHAGGTELDTLGAIWGRHFAQTLGAFVDDPYFHSYPAFDQFIGKRGDRYSSAPMSL